MRSDLPANSPMTMPADVTLKPAAIERADSGHVPALNSCGVIRQGDDAENGLLDSVIEKAGRWLFPWHTAYQSAAVYPGYRRGILGLLRGAVSWGAWQHWRSGRRAMPAWARDIIADAIETRARSGLAIVAELRALPAPAERVAGFAVVDAATGTDRRGGRVGRRRHRAAGEIKG